MPYTHLTQKDRYVISHLTLAGYSLREIGRRIGRSHTSVSREIKRNGPRHPSAMNIYWYENSHPIAIKRQHKPRHHLSNQKSAWIGLPKRLLPV
jgi:IS30 family transposase